MTVLLAYGFRPFFLLAGLYAVLGMLAWLAWLAIHGAGGAVVNPTIAFPVLLWHGHEMLFGFVTAVMAGFFLTAMPNWAGTAPLRHRPLLVLVLLWIAGRLAVWFGAYLPGWLAAVVDLAFLPALAAVIGVTLWRAGAKRNLVLVPILLAMIAGDFLIHLEILGLTGDTARTGLYLAANGIAVLLVIIGGRIVPAFTRSAFVQRGIEASVRTPPMLDRLAILSAVLVLLLELALPDSVATGGMAALAAILNAARLAGWQGHRSLASPILWVLHLGFLWLVLAFAAKAAALLLGWPSPSAALHALTVGAIGTLTMGVMSRAALGHTGRPLRAHRLVAVAYALISVASLIRLFGPGLLASFYTEVMVGAGAVWIAAFALFVVIYLPILTRPRIDGKPG